MSAAASRAKGPLLVGGAAFAGATGALAVRRRRVRSRLRGPAWLPVRDGRIDLDAVAAAGQRVGSLGQQVADIARAVQGNGERSRD